jgi:hypothetical protein
MIELVKSYLGLPLSVQYSKNKEANAFVHRSE